MVNTTNGQWLGGTPQYLVQRYCHAAASYAGRVYVHGGLRAGIPQVNYYFLAFVFFELSKSNNFLIFYYRVGEFLDDLLVSDDGIRPQPLPTQGPQPAIQPSVLRWMMRRYIYIYI